MVQQFSFEFGYPKIKFHGIEFLVFYIGQIYQKLRLNGLSEIENTELEGKKRVGAINNKYHTANDGSISSILFS